MEDEKKNEFDEISIDEIGDPSMEEPEITPAPEVNSVDTLEEVATEDVEELKEKPAEELAAEEPEEKVAEAKEEPLETEKANDPVIIKTESVKEPKNKKSKKTGLTIIIVLLLIIVLALAGLLVWKNLGTKEGTTTKVSNTQKPVSEYRLKGNSLADFDLYFMQLRDQEENKIYSPLSIKYVLAMLNEGTAGTSHDQITALIGDYQSKKYPNTEHMSLANAMFIRNSLSEKVKADYVENLITKYGAEVKIDPFTNASPMNNWISEKTFNLINDVLKDDEVPGYDFFLINALAIDMNWNYQLQCESTGAGVPCKRYNVNYQHEDYSDYVSEVNNHNYEAQSFNGTDVEVTNIAASINKYDIITELGEENIRATVGAEYQQYVDDGGATCGLTFDEFMDGYINALGSNYKKVDESTDFYLYTDSDVKAFAKDLKTYDGITLQYVAIMPTNVSLKEYVKTINAEKVNGIIGKLKNIALDNFKDGVVTKIRGKIPLFKYDYKMDLIEDLKTLGVTDIFDVNTANFSNMLTDVKEAIQKVDHVANIEFSNDGIKASAVTIAGGAGAASCGSFEHKYEVPVEEIDLTFDKPYLYLIRDKDSGEVWFAGTVYEPTKKN